MKVLLLDNYDSFTWNLFHYVDSLGVECRVVRNDEVELSELDHYSHLLLSPGPGLPKDAGKMMEVIRRYHSKKNILGVCLGMQAIGEFFNCSLVQLEKPCHGVTGTYTILNAKASLFHRVNNPFIAGKYHSWVISNPTPESGLIVDAVDELGNPAAISHVNYKVFGVQFHPESIMTPSGKQIIENWLTLS